MIKESETMVTKEENKTALYNLLHTEEYYRKKTETRIRDYKREQRELLKSLSGKTIKKVIKRTCGNSEQWFNKVTIEFTDNTSLILTSNEPDIDYSTDIEFELKKVKK